MAKSPEVSIEDIASQPYSTILCYPKQTETELQYRLRELRKHGVESLEFIGRANAFNVPVLGKGFVGIVVIANVDKQKIALKIRRVDADRLELRNEAKMLGTANSVNVGPKLKGASKNFLLMQLIRGEWLPEWLHTHKEAKLVRTVLSDILEQCWRLDSISLDHGELSKATKHLIIDANQKPWIVDFETASLNRKPANVTSICQFLFINSSKVARIIAESLGKVKRREIIDLLRRYKNCKTRENFNSVLQTCLFQIT